VQVFRPDSILNGRELRIFSGFHAATFSTGQLDEAIEVCVEIDHGTIELMGRGGKDRAYGAIEAVKRRREESLVRLVQYSAAR
jgi:hypothetical protein